MTYVMLKKQLSSRDTIMVPGAYILLAQDERNGTVTLGWGGEIFEMTSECLANLFKRGDVDLTQNLEDGGKK